MKSDNIWKIVSAGAAMLAAVIIRQGMRAAWRYGRGEPPRNPASPDVDWREAVAWTSFVGLAVGLGRLFARRGAASAWRRFAGNQPPIEA